MSEFLYMIVISILGVSLSLIAVLVFSLIALTFIEND